jgi:hypothetical protein
MPATPDEIPDDWEHLCDLCRTPQADLLAHQLVCPDALAYALDPTSLGLREYWAVGGNTWNRHVYRVLGAPTPDHHTKDGRRWYSTWSTGALWGPTVRGAKAPRRAGPLATDLWLGRVGSEVFSTEAHARAGALRQLEAELKLLRDALARVREGPAGGTRYRKQDEARVVHRVQAPYAR